MINILYITEFDPRLSDFGSTQRTNLLWKALQRLGNVYTVSLCDDIIQEERIKSIPRKKRNKIYSFFLLIQNIVLCRLGLDGYGILHNKLSIPLESAFPNVKFDIYVCRYLKPFSEYRLFKYKPFLIDIDDHPIQVFQTTILPRIPSFLRNFAERMKRRRISSLEKKFDGGWISNPLQVSWVSTKQPITPLLNMPPMPSDSYNCDSQRYKYIMMVGRMGYVPNYKGLKRFMYEVWPKFHLLYPDIKFKVVGKGLPDNILKEFCQNDGFEYLGFVNDLNYLYEHCLATVVPVDAGGGTCIKTLESMSHSRVCIVTPFGARGLENTSDNGVFVYHSVDEFIDIFERQVCNEVIRKKNECAGFNFVVANYSFETFCSAVKEQIDLVISNS